MSRCFPYPPPGYCRNGATYEALIESIKLQKETTKTKAERKKEKRAKKEKKEKRQKEKRNNEEEIKLHKNTKGDSHKVLQKAADYTEAQIKGTNGISELYEKSDLTEENGLSISSHQPSYSSDSTQNSNKRKRDHASLLPDSSTAHAKPIKIRLLKKHKGSDSSNFGADARSNSSNNHLSVPSSSNLDRSLVSSIRMNGVPATSGRENMAQIKSSPISEVTKITDPNRLLFGRTESAPMFAKPVFQSTRPQLPILSLGRQVLPQTHLRHEMPSSSISRIRGDELALHSGEQQQRQLAPCHHGMTNPVSSKPSTSASGKRSIREITVPTNDDGLTSLKKQKDNQQKVGPTRFEKKMLKKHAKYKKLVGNLFPPVFQAHVPDVDDEDWLSRRKTPKTSSYMGEVETCRQVVAPWQPCARFLSEVDIHALPYTVPF